MAEGEAPAPKKAKRSAPAARVSAEERAKQFKEDLYSDSGVLFCTYCEHSIDFVRLDTIKDHLKSKKGNPATQSQVRLLQAGKLLFKVL